MRQHPGTLAAVNHAPVYIDSRTGLRILAHSAREAFVAEFPTFAGKAHWEIRELLAGHEEDLAACGWILPTGYVAAKIRASKES